MVDDTEITALRTTVDGRTLPVPREQAMTGPQMRGLAGAKPGKQVDRTSRLGIGWDTYLTPQGRAWGREEGVLDVIKAIRDLDPMASDAVWVYLRLLNPGHELKAVALNDVNGEPQELGGAAQVFLDDLTRRVGAEYGGGLDQLHNVLALTLLTTGAVAAEVAPTEGLNDVEDWYPVDPGLLSFRRDPETQVLQLGQMFSDGVWMPLPTEQVFYVPLDPDVDDPYGRPPMLPAIQAVMARAQMLNDIRAVAHQAGYPRISVEVMWEIVQSAAPPQLREPGREVDFQAWAERQLTKLVADYQALNVDDTFVHYDWVKPTLMAASGLSFDFPALDNVLQRQLNAGLKMLPILLGINEGSTESHGSVQWQIQIAGIRAFQRILKRVIEKMGSASLALAGFNARAHLEYHQTRTVDRLYEAQAELFEAQNLKMDVDMGWRSNDEAALERTDHEAVAAPGEQSAAQLAADKAVASQQIGPSVGDQGAQAPDQKQKADPMWQLLWNMMSESPVAARKPGVAKTLDGDEIESVSLTYAEKARAVFRAQLSALVQSLMGEGMLRSPESRATPTEIADDAFGRSYAREMKKLLRQSIEDGMRRAGDPNPVVDEKIVRRIWAENEPFVERIRNDLRTQIRSWSDTIRAGGKVGVDDVATWFDQNAYREAMMGQFLTKQGYAAGFTRAGFDETGKTVFRWDLGPVKTEHCADCLKRAGQTYTNAQLQEIGMPGSLKTECGSACKCSVTMITCSKAQVSTARIPHGMIREVLLTEDQLDTLTDDELDAYFGKGTVPARLDPKGDVAQSTAEACRIVPLDGPPNADQMAAAQRKWADGLSEPEQDSLQTYVQFGQPYNWFLRGETGTFDTWGMDPEASKRVIANVDKALAKGTIQRETTVWRGASAEALGHPVVGGEFGDAAFVSTSLEQNVARQFVELVQESDLTPVYLKIRIPAGSKGAYLDGWLDDSGRRVKDGVTLPRQKEVLLPRDSRFRLIGKRDTIAFNGQHIEEWDVDLVP